MKLKFGKKTHIHSYKHDGSLHRVWLNTYILEDQEDVLITGNYATKVVEHNGRSWYTKEPAICYFYKHEWFNIIAMLKKDGIHYYCNLSSPFIFDHEAIKYIDYDLDLKLFPSGKILHLDQNEYDVHKDQMSYDLLTQEIVQKSSEKLEKKMIKKEAPFDQKSVLAHYELFKKILRKKPVITKEKI